MDWKKFLLLQGASAMQSTGQMLKLQDVNSTGKDDVFGAIFSIGGQAATAYAQGKPTQTVDDVLKTLRDALNAEYPN